MRRQARGPSSPRLSVFVGRPIARETRLAILWPFPTEATKQSLLSNKSKLKISKKIFTLIQTNQSSFANTNFGNDRPMTRSGNARETLATLTPFRIRG